MRKKRNACNIVVIKPEGRRAPAKLGVDGI
jgi:hypothetical protein